MQKTKIIFAYKSGFRRLWLVVSGLWLIFMTYMVVNESNLHAVDFLAAGIGPVVVVYLLGAAIVWIIEGFARADR